MYRLGRLLQLVGMIVLPVAIAGNLVPENPLDLRQSLMRPPFRASRVSRFKWNH